VNRKGERITEEFEEIIDDNYFDKVLMEINCNAN
jgi:hypothetical protein